MTPTFIEAVLDRVFVPDDIDRAALEADKQALEQQLANLTTAIKAARDPRVVVGLVEEMEATNTHLVVIRRHLEPREAANRAELRAALKHRVDDWKGVLRQHPVQARQVLHHLLDGPIRILPSDGAELEAILSAGFSLDDQRGKEGITADDMLMHEADFREIADAMRSIAGMVAWTATVRPSGLLAGLPGSCKVLGPR